ncbi:MAG: acyl-CoA thioesterase [Gammaproteobacteria bacterium]|nr:acyl-CoA thioesterase [Gammaproteobacteria bacterium]
MTEHCRIIGDTFYSDRLVRFSHCDPAGIVFYPQYFIMFNGLVEDWFNQGLGVNYARYITEHKLGFPIVSLNCEFSATSTIGEIITPGAEAGAAGKKFDGNRRRLPLQAGGAAARPLRAGVRRSQPPARATRPRRPARAHAGVPARTTRHQ